MAIPSNKQNCCQDTSDYVVYAGDDEDAKTNEDTSDYVMYTGDDEEEKTNDELVPRSKSLTKMDILLLAVLSLCQLFGYMFYSVPFIFFPDIAKTKNVSTELVGYIYSFFNLGALFFSPIVGYAITKIGTKNVVLSSLILASVTSLTFAFTDKIESKYVFVAACIILRVLGGIAAVSIQTAAYSVVALKYQHCIGMASGLLEVCQALSYSFGESIGGIVYQYFGYTVPFAAISVFLIILALTFWKFIPSNNYHKDVKENASIRESLNMLKKPLMYAALIPTFFFFIHQSPITSYIPKLIKHFTNKTDSQIGLLVFVNCVVYCIITPFIGYIVDKMQNFRLLMIIGFFLRGVTAVLLDPKAITNINGSYTLIYIGFCLASAGTSFAFIPTFKHYQTQAKDSGYANNFHNSAVISSLLSAVISLGSFLGPIISGYLLEECGYDITFLILAIIVWAMIPILLGDMIRVKLASKKRNDPERTPFVINNDSV